MRIAIIGAGIIGRLLALLLSRQQYQVTVFERDAIESGSAASYTAAGMLTPVSEAESAEPLVCRMGRHSLRLWPQVVEQLNLTDAYWQRGSLVVAHASDRAELQRFCRQLVHRRQSCRNLSSEQLSVFEPELTARFQEAVFLPHEACLDVQKIMAGLAQTPIDWRPHTTVEKTASGSLWIAGNRHCFDWVIDCRGLGAKQEWPALRGVRGELLWLHAPEVALNHMVRLMHPRYRLYVVPRPGNLYIVGATQIESDDSGPITVRSSLELLSAVYSLHPGFAEAAVVSSAVNCRPALPDNCPAVRCEERLLRVNGLFRHGFLLAPVVAGEVANWLAADGAYQSPYTGLFQQEVLM